MEKIVVRSKYAGLPLGSAYDLLHEGRDYLCIRCRGKVLYVPKWVELQDRGLDNG
jgi:hypothetical protein